MKENQVCKKNPAGKFSQTYEPVSWDKESSGLNIRRLFYPYCERGIFSISIDYFSFGKFETEKAFVLIFLR